jgi:hypothetical protein
MGTAFGSVGVGRAGQGIDRFGALGDGIEPGMVKLEKDPLGPSEIAGVGGVDLARPIVAEAERFDLAAERGDVPLGRLARVLAGLDGVLFGGQAEGVPAHGMQDMIPLGAAISGEDVGGGVTFGMADVQARAGRVGEHVEDVVFAGELFGGDGFIPQSVPLAERVVGRDGFAGVPGAEELVISPVLLPFGFDEMERIRPACAEHRGGVSGNRAGVGNGRVNG